MCGKEIPLRQYKLIIAKLGLRVYYYEGMSSLSRGYDLIMRGNEMTQVPRDSSGKVFQIIPRLTASN